MTVSHETASHDEDAPTGNTASVLSRIHQANLTEIALGKIAEDRASAPEVRAYAGQLIQDHANVDEKVAAMAHQKGVHLREQTASTRQGGKGVQSAAQFEQLMSASGAKFDQLFLQQAGSDHQRLIQRLQQDREDANDDEVEALIDKIVPLLEQHRELAQILMKKERT